jgi:hypothetical protein
MTQTQLLWRRSGRCETSGCVEAAITADAVLVRDGKLGDKSPVLSFSPQEWAAFIGGAVDGDFDPDASGGHIRP